MPTYHFTYASVIESEEKMLDDVSAALAENDISDDEFHRMTLVISEAFTNALTHGNGRDPKKRIYVHLDINQNMICADIIDEGRGALDRIERKRPPEPLAENGRGIDLIRHCTDEAIFQEHESGGLRVSVVVKRQKRANIHM